MKLSLAGLVLLNFAITVGILAQQTEADRKLLADIRTKAETGNAQSQSELGAVFFSAILACQRMKKKE